MKSTQQYLDKAESALESTRTVDDKSVIIHGFIGVGLALIAIAGEIRMANRLKLWEHGAINRPEIGDDYDD